MPLEWGRHAFQWGTYCDSLLGSESLENSSGRGGHPHALHCQAPSELVPEATTPTSTALSTAAQRREIQTVGSAGNTPWVVPKPQDPTKILGHLSRVFFPPKPEALMKKKQSARRELRVQLCSPQRLCSNPDPWSFRCAVVWK